MTLFKKPEEHSCHSGLDKAPDKTFTEKLKEAVKPILRETGNGTVQAIPPQTRSPV